MAQASAEYFRKYRAAHPEYRSRERERTKRRKAAMSPEERRKDRGSKPKALIFEPLPPIYPELNRGASFSFWEDELRMDLAQERILAELEGRDPAEATKAYRSREMAHFIFAPYQLPEDQIRD